MATVSNEGIRTYGVTNRKDLVEMYPIGSIYMSVDSTSPASLFGGTWQQLEGRTLVGAGTVTDENNLSQTFTLGADGGELKHTLTVDEMPSHNHALGGAGWSAGSEGFINWSDKKNQVTLYSAYVGGSQAHNNLPPYLVVNIWKRIPPIS